MDYRNIRRRPLRSRRGRPASRPGLIALAAGGPILVLGYFLAAPTASHPTASHPTASQATTSHTTAAADEQSAPTSVSPGGWGRGGYPMMNGYGSAAPVTHASLNAAAAVTQMTSANWAGYAAAGPAGSFTSVSSSWTEPAVTCAVTGTFSSFWVGLDGDGTSTVEQTGTEADCAGGAASYQGWYEVFPNAPVFWPDPVRPGDVMSASVTSDGNGMFTLTLSDGTQGWTQSTQQAEPAAQLGSAEVIAEAPSSGSDTLLPLADFGAVNFTAAMVNHAPIGASAGLSELTMTAATGTALATPSALAGGDAFTITAQAGAASTATGTGTGTGTATGPGGPGASMGGGGGASDGGGGRHHHHV